MGRRSVWSNEQVIAATRDFVPAVDEVWRLQRGTDAESRHFQAMADQGHYGGGGGTRQGLYVLTADGTFLASSNHLSAERALATLAAGMDAWKRTSKAQRTLPEDWSLPRKRWEDSLPHDAMILRTYNADLGEGAQRERLNRDHVWITKEEAAGWLPAAPRVGAVHPIAPVLRDRIARFHLVDNVRGQTLPFASEDVAASRLTTTITHVDDTRVQFVIEGAIRSETDGTWLMGENDWKPKAKFPRGVSAEVVGFGEQARDGTGFTKLSFVAWGERTGRTNLNGRAQDDVGPAGIGWVFELVPQKPSTRIAPAFVDVYNADWIEDPR